MSQGIFVSYAHADDAPFRDGVDGWVTTFVGHLRKQLSRQAGGRQVQIWMDHALRPQREVDGELAKQVSGSDCFVAMMSPGYLDSPWCAGEIGKFVEKMGGKTGDRVFVVELLETDRTRWHPATQKLSILQCWQRDQPGTPGMTIGWPQPDPMNDKAYWTLVNNLAHLIAEELQRTPPVQLTDTTPPIIIDPDPTLAVWIAEPTDDLAEEWQLLVNSLRQQGIEVLPSADYVRREQSAWEQGLAADLGRAGLLVQLLGPQPGRVAAWSPLSFAQLQAQAAADAAQARKLEHLIWRPADLDLARVKNEDYLKWLCGSRSGGFNDFRQHVLDVWARLQTKPELPRTAAGDSPLIYINADDCDLEIGKEVCGMLVDLGADAVLAAKPAPNLQPAEFRKQLEDQIATSDGMLIVYGHAPAQWAQSQFALARKARALARRGSFALLDAPPSEKPGHGIFSPTLTVFDCRRGITAGPLQNFIDIVRDRQHTAQEVAA